MANITTTSTAVRFRRYSVNKSALSKVKEITGDKPGVQIYGFNASIQIYLTDTVNGQSFSTTKSLLEYVDANFFYDGGGSGSGAAWGSITGDIESQTDLQEKLESKIGEGEVLPSDMGVGIPPSNRVFATGTAENHWQLRTIDALNTGSTIVARTLSGAIFTSNATNDSHAVNLGQLNGLLVPTNIVSDDSTLSLNIDSVYTFTDDGAATWTLPPITGNSAHRISIIHMGDATLTVQGNGADTDAIYEGGLNVSSIAMNTGDINIFYNNSLKWIMI